MQIQYQMEQQSLRIVVPKELDHHVADKIKEESEQWLSQGNIRRVVFDFTNTEFMDSSGIGVIIGRVKRMRGLQGDVTACQVSPHIYRIMAMSGLNKIIGIDQKEDEWKRID